MYIILYFIYFFYLPATFFISLLALASLVKPIFAWKEIEKHIFLFLYEIIHVKWYNGIFFEFEWTL